MRKKQWIWHICLFVVLVSLDQISKFWISSSMQLSQSITVIPSFFQITYLHNTGAAWSMLEGKMLFFYVVTIVALIVMGYFYVSCDKKDKLTLLGLVMMIAGTCGNFIDRVIYQYVRDFLDFYILGYDFPVFNIADMALCIGVFFILVSVVIDHFGGVKTCVK